MGLLRVLLALTVVLGHFYGWVFMGPIFAVQMFYVISGFLISYILVEARSYAGLRAFYENRVLRLFPVYWTVAGATLAMFVAGALVAGNLPPFLEVYRDIDAAGRAALSFSNLFIFGQDWIMFTVVRDGVFQFAADYRQSQFPVWHGLLIPQAWTLGVELSFYLIAPFILGRLRLVVVLLVLSIALRLALIRAGIGLDDPWSYRFFPTELALFLAGALAHQVWMPLVARRGWLTDRAAAAVSGALLLHCLLFALLPSKLLLLAAFLLALPFLFHFQRRHRWDRWIGDLSYPIYICHMSLIFLIGKVWDRATGVEGHEGWDETAVVLVAVLAASVALKFWVADPVEALRDRVRRAPRLDPRLAGRQ